MKILPRSLFSINTDIKSYHDVHQGDSGNPFDFWLRDGFAFLTPYDDRSLKTYSNALAKVRPGDLIFAYESRYLGSRRGYIGLGTALAEWDRVSHPGHKELYGDSYSAVFRIAVDWNTEFTCSLDEVQAVGAESLLATICQVSKDPLKGLLTLKGEKASTERQLRSDDEMIAAIRRDPSIPETEKTQLIRARVGQGRFREAVRRIESRCRLTHVSHPDMLRASHIKPWRNATNLERLDGNNGLLLAPHVDHLFDGGWITFDETGKLIFSPFLPQEALRLWHLPENVETGPFNKAQIEYLRYHHMHVFKRPIAE